MEAVALLIFEATAPLALAHQRGIAHGNIESTSVLIEPNGVRCPTERGRAHPPDPGQLTDPEFGRPWDEPIYLSPAVLNRHPLEPLTTSMPWVF